MRKYGTNRLVDVRRALAGHGQRLHWGGGTCPHPSVSGEQQGMDAPRNSQNRPPQIDISEVPPGWLESVAGKDTVLGHAVRRHLQERDSRSGTTEVVFESAL
ncbi:FxSxx-COOH cyclophane-containing RiPP peptide [Streptomyces caniscabiei]|uniref:FxSxx-COOH cyclophane-containing RiPP peptide n=2 Tax=Streptomyces caniscabiei TaxID=2746961 RepID=UPI0030B946F9